MAGAEKKELEETIVELGNSLLAPPSDVDELLRLLDKAESFLSRVEQSPSESMSAALHPAMKALIAKELLGHSDADVKVAVASCISEITRITAPEAPYNDDLMREIFQMIVKAFEKLDDISSHSYSKRVSILETVAKVRSCVVMLDLECDDLILEMFHHFLRTVRDDHPENVLSSMEVIMTLVLEESEDISPELLSRLLTNVKKDAMDILPVAKTLAEKVISNCAFKLKPCLMDVVQSLGVPLSDYSKIVATMCQENSDVLEHNGLNASGECVADDSKFSERTVSDELAQGSGKMESEVSCPEVGTASGRSPKSVMSNGIIQAGNDGSLAEPTSPNKKTELPKNASATRTEADKSDLIDVRDTSSDHSNKKSKGHKGNSAQLTNVNDNSQIVDEKGDTELPNRKKGNRKGPESSQSECPSSKEIEPATLKEDREVVEPQVASEKSKKDKASVVSPSSNEKLPDTSRPKRGRPAGAKGFTKKAGVGDAPVSPSGSHKAKAIEETDTEALLSFKKQKEGTKDLDTEPNRHSGKKQSARTVDDSGKGSYSNRKMEVDVGSDEERMHLRKRRKPGMELNEGDTSVKRQASKSKQQKIRDSSDNEMISSPRMAAKGDEDQVVLEETLKSKSGKKRAREEISKSPGVALKYDESLIGAKIKVWWPVDEKFYPGTVDSYNPVLKKHKVIYFDGDEEILLLKNEHFELIEDGEEEEENNDLAPEAASEMFGTLFRLRENCTRGRVEGERDSLPLSTGKQMPAPREWIEHSVFHVGNFTEPSEGAPQDAGLVPEAPEEGEISAQDLASTSVEEEILSPEGETSGLVENFQAAEEAPLPEEEPNIAEPVVEEEAPPSVEVPNSAALVFEEVVVTSGCNEAGVATSLPGDSQIDNVTAESTSSGGESIFDEFPEHGIEWPAGSQLEAVCRSDAILEAFIGTAKASMQAETPPPFDTMRDILRRQTVAYHLMGFAKEPWMAAIGSVWGELCRLHEAAAWEHHKLEI